VLADDALAEVLNADLQIPTAGGAFLDKVRDSHITYLLLGSRNAKKAVRESKVSPQDANFNKQKD
jgi:hypothetical protein